MEMSTALSSSFFARFCPDPTIMYDLAEMYAEFNAKFFNGELEVLPTVSFVDKAGEKRTVTGKVKWDGRLGKRTYGLYKSSVGGNGKGMIYLNRRIASDPVKVRSVLLHEMVHKYLDMKGFADGIKGHGPNFISEANRINNMCEAMEVAHRVNFMDEAVSQEEPTTFAVALNREIAMGKDLDVAVKMKTIMRSAFDTKFVYNQ